MVDGTVMMEALLLPYLPRDRKDSKDDADISLLFGMLFDGEGAPGLQEGGTAAAMALVFLPTDVANDAKDDCTKAAVKAANGCSDNFYAKKVSLEPDKLEGGGVVFLFEPLNKVIVNYIQTDYLPIHRHFFIFLLS